QCNLAGWWKNDLGSKMQVFNVDNQGDFSGMYHTAVSSTQKPSPLRGSQHLDEDDQCTFGFIVNWKTDGHSVSTDSTAVFMGQCFMDDKEWEVLQTAWLLHKKVNNLGSNWKAIR
ncbi:AVID protein, partial [Crypturellus soui]|nr:AVID protein [Crypturellus soui]